MQVWEDTLWREEHWAGLEIWNGARMRPEKLDEGRRRRETVIE